MDQLEETLNQLNSYGLPRLSRMDRGWFCTTEMFVSAKGAKVEIKSEFDHPSALAAAQTCLERVSAVLRDISRMADQKALPNG